MSHPRLTETSYIVLGLLEHLQPATPYDIKQLAQLSTFNFWTVPHTQIYTECARLADVGLLAEEREETGRRRRIFRLTEEGAAALEDWRGGASTQGDEGRAGAPAEAVLRAGAGASSGSPRRARRRWRTGGRSRRPRSTSCTTWPR